RLPEPIFTPATKAELGEHDENVSSAALVGNVTHGALQLAANGGFSYTPTAGFTGVDTFSYDANNDGTADAQHVLALTFTRDAAGELRRRLRRLDVQQSIECGTFHAVALRLLRDRALATNSGPPTVAPDRLRLVREVLTETRLRRDPVAVMSDLDWARARLIEPYQFGEACRRARRRGAVDGPGFVAVSTAYAALKRRRGVVDFDDLLAHVLDHMRSDPTFAEIVRWRFRHLFVDEAQDLNPLQFAVLESIRDGRPDICLVGDHRQAIYGWNGSDPTALLEVEQRFRGVTVISLTGNYRCSPQIVSTGAAALAAAGIEDTTESRRTDGRRPVFAPADDDIAEAASVAARVRDLVQRHGPREVAVLARTNEQLQVLHRSLDEVGVPVARSLGASPLEKAVAEATRLRTRDELAAWIEGVWTSDTSDPIRGRVAEEADRFLTSNDPGGFRAWLEARQPFDDLEPDDEGAVSLLTFHSAKGREWNAIEPLVAAVPREHVAPMPASIRPERPPDPLVDLRAWRADVARAAGVSEQAVCSDRVLKSLVDDPPGDAAGLAVRLGVSPSVADRWARRLLPAGSDLTV
ncbi:MAG: UvrD-helicase domain-containing protein, partial [Actinobacteria bacterium]|nr:UvrD-helicase domain-containing protein [Actinomycetota bacterium]